MSKFDELYKLNVNEKTESKNGLTYLSWAWAWAEFKKAYPSAEYNVWRDEQGRPYVYDPNLGYMVYTRVTADNLTHEMWLPVMDGANHAMKAEPYTIATKYKSVTVAPATMMDINKTIMRCLTKNLAMFGLGLYIYAGEDLPEEASEEDKYIKAEKKTSQKAFESVKTDEERINAEQKAELISLGEQYTGCKAGVEEWLAKQMKLRKLDNCPVQNYIATRDYLIAEIERKKAELEDRKAEA